MSAAKSPNMASLLRSVISKLFHIVARPQRLLLILGIGMTVGLYLYVRPRYCIAMDCVSSATYWKDRLLQHLQLAYAETDAPEWNGTVGDKVLVIGHTDAEDVSWVEQYLPDWQRALYNVNQNHSVGESLVIPKNKGNEAMVYLTYIVDHYDELPSTMVFLHAHRDGYQRAWHTDAPLHDHVNAVRSLQLHYVAEAGYVNLRCHWNPGCEDGPQTGAKASLPPGIWNDVFRHTSTPPRWLAEQISITQEPLSSKPDKADFSEDRINTDALPYIGVPCCSQFAVSSTAVKQRGKDDYVAFRQWLLDTPLTSATSGSAFEYLWHIIFGEPAVSCPIEDFCFCAVYGKC